MRQYSVTYLSAHHRNFQAVMRRIAAMLATLACTGRLGSVTGHAALGSPTSTGIYASASAIDRVATIMRWAEIMQHATTAPLVAVIDGGDVDTEGVLASRPSMAGALVATASSTRVCPRTDAHLVQQQPHLSSALAPLTSAQPGQCAPQEQHMMQPAALAVFPATEMLAPVGKLARKPPLAPPSHPSGKRRLRARGTLPAPGVAMCLAVAQEHSSVRAANRGMCRSWGVELEASHALMLTPKPLPRSAALSALPQLLPAASAASRIAVAPRSGAAAATCATVPPSTCACVQPPCAFPIDLALGLVLGAIGMGLMIMLVMAVAVARLPRLDQEPSPRSRKSKQQQPESPPSSPRIPMPSIPELCAEVRPICLRTTQYLRGATPAANACIGRRLYDERLSTRMSRVQDVSEDEQPSSPTSIIVVRAPAVDVHAPAVIVRAPSAMRAPVVVVHAHQVHSFCAAVLRMPSIYAAVSHPIAPSMRPSGTGDWPNSLRSSGHDVGTIIVDSDDGTHDTSGTCDLLSSARSSAPWAVLSIHDARCVRSSALTPLASGASPPVLAAFVASRSHGLVYSPREASVRTSLSSAGCRPAWLSVS